MPAPPLVVLELVLPSLELLVGLVEDLFVLFIGLLLNEPHHIFDLSSQEEGTTISAIPTHSTTTPPHQQTPSTPYFRPSLTAEGTR